MNFVPPREAFEFPIQTTQQRQAPGTYDIPNLLSVTKTSSGEMATVFGGHPLPRKGMTYFEVTAKNNEVKRITLSLFAPFSNLKKGLMAFIESYLENYCRLADSVYFQCERVPYLKKELYANNCKAIWDITKVFLVEIGISEQTADHTGKVLATILQYDDAYRLPLVDAFDEITQEEAVKSPRKALSKLIAIMGERTANHLLVDKFNAFKTLLNFILLVPKFNKALKKAFASVKWHWLQYTPEDYYWTLCKDDYNYQGRGWEERANEQLKYMAEHIAKTTGCKEVRFEKISDKEVKVIPVCE